MLEQSIDIDLFLGQLLTMVKSVVVKRSEEASKYETVDTRTEADRYIAMKEGGSSWSSFVLFDLDVMEAAGMNKQIIQSVYAGNKESIPYEFRDLVCQLQAEKIIDNYVEHNTYYRMLNGEPPEDTTEDEYVYMWDNDFGIPTNIPIHKLPNNYLEYINTSSIRQELKEKYPDKPYLQFLGSRSIPYYKSRTAANFDILYIEKSDNMNISNAFIKEYAASRNYVMHGLYNKADERTYDYYDSFMGFVIMAMTIQRTITSIFESGISRDFFDDKLIRYLLEAYNISYIDSINVYYQRIIAKRLNILLQKKASNNVLFDIVDIFGYNVNIFKYYLMKDYYKDSNGNPIIIYKTIYDENGKAHKIIDPERTYDIYFQKVNIKSKDVSSELVDKANRMEYKSITGGDPYWIEDSDLLNKIYDNKFNSILTKYMSIDVSYELAKIMYETSYTVRMIIDRQEEYKEIYISLPYVVDKVSLFDAVLFLCALSAKKFNLAGNVPLQPYQIAQVYGFNFKTDIDKLKQDIVDDVQNCTGKYRAVRLDILDHLKNLHADSLEGARNMFNNIEDLRKWIDTAMRYSKSIEEYEAYQKIYKATLVVTDVQELYTKTDGSYAGTFAELLQNRRPDLYEVLESTGSIQEDNTPGLNQKETTSLFSINEKINKVLDKLSDIAVQLKDLHYINDKEAIVNNIEKLINQFKSYTVDQNTSNVLYIINDPHLCLLKIIDYIWTANKNTGLDERLQMLYQDVFHMIIPRRVWVDKMDVNEWIDSDKKEIISRIIRLVNDLWYEKKTTNLDMATYIVDALDTATTRFKLPSDVLRIVNEYESNKTISVIDLIKIIDYFSESMISGNIIDNTNLIDVTHLKTSETNLIMAIHLLNMYTKFIDINVWESIDLLYTIYEHKEGNLDAFMPVFDNTDKFSYTIDSDVFTISYLIFCINMRDAWDHNHFIHQIKDEAKKARYNAGTFIFDTKSSFMNKTYLDIITKHFEVEKNKNQIKYEKFNIAYLISGENKESTYTGSMTIFDDGRRLINGKLLSPLVIHAETIKNKSQMEKDKYTIKDTLTRNYVE